MKSEFDFIEKLRRRVQTNAAKTGIGDDCAVIPKDAKTDLVITADLLVENIDFRLEWTTAEFVGHKALAVSLSDVAAMGAKPVWSMISIGVPEKIWKTDFVDEFYAGWFRLAKKFDVELIGGDVSRTPDKIVIDSIAAGETRKGKAVLRSGARAGDLIFVTGNLGGAAAGLKLLEAGERYEKRSKSFVQKLLWRQLKPNPQTEIGRILGEKNLATAMIDLSDGLSSDLAHLCRESKIGARIFAEKIPSDENLRKFLTPSRQTAKPQNKKTRISDEMDFALHGGEDFELLFTANPKKNFRLEKELRNFNFSCIGRTTVTAEIIELISADKTAILERKGFRHF
ncbi:MAG TPA: thiamine-phosphate kinase [Pyrinomonadaceae bacterium]